MNAKQFMRKSWRRISHYPLIYLFLFPIYVLTELLFHFRAPSMLRRSFGSSLTWTPGVSVIIPHRGPVKMLAQCLEALNEALSKVSEPYEVILVFNDVNRAECEELCQAFDDLILFFQDEPLGFTSSVSKGLELAKYDGVYLLNNDMILEPDALAQILKWRSAYVFAIASQIFFPPDRRREETGWTTIDFRQGIPFPRHLEPEDPHTVRGTAYAGAGSSLFNKRLLKQLIGKGAPFDPFYWEDVDWSFRAWHVGYDILFCPESRALHKHRATVERYYSATTVNHVFERNRINFFLRNPHTHLDFRTALTVFLKQGFHTLADLSELKQLPGMIRSRFDAWRSPRRDLDISVLHRHVFLQAPVSRVNAKKKLVIVTPYCIFPPRHGGAVRSQMLIRYLSEDFSITLISDEAGLYEVPQSLPFMEGLASLYLVDGRPIEEQTENHLRIRRIHSHSHQVLINEVSRLLTNIKPDLVMVEHMELGGLSSLRDTFDIPFVLNLHDVFLSPDDPAQAAADAFETPLIKQFDAVAICSEEDRLLLSPIEATVVPNGVEMENKKGFAYTPSNGNHNILFIGPFRCQANLDGIVKFLDTAWPEVKDAVSNVSLTIVGGKGAKTSPQLLPYLNQKNVIVLESIADVRKALKLCAVTINPHMNLRGSSVKLIESLAAGRVCVSTISGARGFTQAGVSSLIAEADIADFQQPLIRLLTNEDYRLSIEAPETDKLLPFTWSRSAQIMNDSVFSKALTH